MCPPYFPVHFSELEGDIDFHDVTDDDLDDRRRQGARCARCRTSVRPSATGSTGTASASPTSATTRQPHDRRQTIADACSSCADGVDLLIHDAQYTPAEFARRRPGATARSTTPCWSPGGRRQAAGAVPPRPAHGDEDARPAARLRAVHRAGPASPRSSRLRGLLDHSRRLTIAPDHPRRRRLKTVMWPFRHRGDHRRRHRRATARRFDRAARSTPCRSTRRWSSCSRPAVEQLAPHPGRRQVLREHPGRDQEAVCRLRDQGRRQVRRPRVEAAPVPAHP